MQHGKMASCLPKGAILPTGLGHVINVYTFDCQLGVTERIDYLLELLAHTHTHKKFHFNLKLQTSSKILLKNAVLLRFIGMCVIWLCCGS